MLRWALLVWQEALSANPELQRELSRAVWSCPQAFTDDWVIFKYEPTCKTSTDRKTGMLDCEALRAAGAERAVLPSMHAVIVAQLNDTLHAASPA